MIEIRNRYTRAVILRDETATTIREAVVSLCAAEPHQKWRRGEAEGVAGANLAGANLAGAYLADANLAGANLAGANLAGAYLADANLAGANLAGANLAGANLADANLAGANLADANLADANLADANLADANLTDADLTGANLADANLTGANLTGAYLTGADLAGADIPKIEKIDSAILAAITGGGKLDMGDWHKCGTTHCRAGWAIHLAGAPGYALEKRLGSSAAGALIYATSRPDLPVPDFHCSNETAMADLRACAEREGKTPADVSAS